jgi:thiamine biosynthesis lipoprotein
MNTDIVCEIVCTSAEVAQAESRLDEAFAMFREFESRYSRFNKDNELWRLNKSEKAVVSEELFEILCQAKRYHEITGGIFDPSILRVLEVTGYTGAYNNCTLLEKTNFSQLILDKEKYAVTKPKNLLIDLGGIGKGFVIDKVTRFLNERFDNVLVDAGGDIAVRGVNATEGYDYWAIDIEHPKHPDEIVATLLLKDNAVATSGRNRKRWVSDGQSRHHIINPLTQESASDELLSVSVIAPSATEADVFAKTLFISGQEKGRAMADDWKLPAVFINKEGLVARNHYTEPYVWKP